MKQKEEIKKIQEKLRILINSHELTQSPIVFKVGKVEHKWTVIHNMPYMIRAAFDNWIARTSNYSAYSFVKYVDSKRDAGMTDDIVMLQEDVEVMLDLKPGEMDDYITKKNSKNQ